MQRPTLVRARGLHRAVQRSPAGHDLRADRADDGDGGHDDQTRDQGVLKHFAALFVTNQLAQKLLHDQTPILSSVRFPMNSHALPVSALARCARAAYIELLSDVQRATTFVPTAPMT